MTLTGDRKREYQREWLRQRRLSYLADKACASCGGTENLEIDHIDPGTKDPLLRKNGNGALWSWSKARQEVELAKCQALCSRCHDEKTMATRHKTGHGTGQMYQKHRCRCDRCRAWKAEECREYRTRKAAREVMGSVANRGPG